MPSDGGSESGRDGSSDGRSGGGGETGGRDSGYSLGGGLGLRARASNSGFGLSDTDSGLGLRDNSSSKPGLKTGDGGNRSVFGDSISSRPATNQPTAQTSVANTLSLAKKTVGVATNLLGIASGNPIGVASGLIGLAEAAKGLFSGETTAPGERAEGGIYGDRGGNDNSGGISFRSANRPDAGSTRVQLPRGESKAPIVSAIDSGSDSPGGDSVTGGYIATENTSPVVVKQSGIDFLPIAATIGAILLFGA